MKEDKINGIKFGVIKEDPIMAEYDAVVKPLMDFLKKNGIYTKAIVTANFTTLLKDPTS